MERLYQRRYNLEILSFENSMHSNAFLIVEGTSVSNIILRRIWTYSTDQTQPNTEHTPKADRGLSFNCVCSGFVWILLFKSLLLLGVCYGFAWGQLLGFALRAEV